MNISKIFIKKPVMTVLVFVTVLVFGVIAYFEMPISELPTVDVPVITISASLPGASPETMASSVASPLENECMQIPGIQSIISNNTEGFTQVILTFDLNQNVDLAAPDVQAAISRAQGNLPTLPDPPQYSKYNPSDSPIIYIVVSSDTLTPAQLYDVAHKRIAQRINMVDGVSKVDCYGAKGAVRVQIDPTKAAAYGVGLNEIASRLMNSTPMIPGGGINGNYKAFSINPDGQLVNAKGYNNLIVKYKNNSPLRISDLGRAVDSTENDICNVVFFKKGHKEVKMPVLVMAYRRPGSNTVELTNKIRSLLDTLKKEIPGSAKIQILYDKSTTIIESINDVKFTLVLAFILVVLVIYVFFGRISDTIIPAVALPLSIIGTFLVIKSLGFSIDNLSLLALTLSIGFVVDDAIVVLENTVRLIEEGMSPFEAALESAKEIVGTVITMDMALIAVFIPLALMGGIVGRTFREFALTVIIAVTCSGVVSLSLTPMMCARMLRSYSSENSKNIILRVNDFIVGSFINGYKIILHKILKHQYISVLIWAICIFGTVAFYTIVPKGFLPVGDSGVISGGLLVPLGTPSKLMSKFQKSVDNVLEEDSSVKHFVTATGLSVGADQSTGFTVAMLKDKEKRPPIQQVVDELNMKFMNLNYPLGLVFIEPVPVLEMSAGGTNTAAGAKYSYTITGQDRGKVYSSANRLELQLHKMSAFADVQSSVKLAMPQLKISINRERASTFGITVADIENALAFSYAQGKVAQFTTDIDQYDVILELTKKDQVTPGDLGKIYVKSTQTGKLVPFKAIASWKEILSPQQIIHTNQMESATLSFNIKGNVPIGVATKQLERVAGKTLSPGVNGSFEGEAQEFQSAVISMTILVLVAVFLMYIILGILYESYIHPFTVLTTLPVAAFGGIGTLLIFHSELNLYAYVGLFMLLGIVAKNGIMMIDFAKQNLENGESRFDAIFDACIVRFRPILMTGMAAIMGALPIAIGVGADGESRRSLGLVIVGGLIFSQIITLFVTPGVYLYMEAFQEKFLDKFEFTRSAAARKKMENKR
jgi:hydrophobic/amphiphilic exporter-1 (mainly G- bacteria), HAE1 family